MANSPLVQKTHTEASIPFATIGMLVALTIFLPLVRTLNKPSYRIP
jgi:hypothetical protein